MSLVGSIRSNYRYVIGLRSYLREQITVDQARAGVEQQLATRSQSFLESLEQLVYTNPISPYFKLLEHAGIELEEVRRLVSEAGLEGALARLYDAGVYLTQEEFKGREAVKRGALEFKTTVADSARQTNPSVGEIRTSGSTGDAVNLQWDFHTMSARAIRHFLAYVAVRDDRPLAAWDAQTPSMDLGLAKVGIFREKHFSTNTFRGTSESLRSTIFNSYTLFAVRLYGRPVPRLEYASRENPLPVVKWLAKKVEEGSPALLDCPASLATRACLLAKEHGIDIAGTLFLLHGEPYTPGKAQVLRSVGATARVYYSMVGASPGQPCGNPAELDEVHLAANSLALIQREKVTTSGAIVPGLVVTAVRPTNASRFALNLETGDYADVSHRDCGCFLEELGFGTHLSGIRSYEKLTSEGITFMGSRLYQLVEEVLPTAFGGGPGDYQLVEEEQGGLPRVSIVVSPRVGAVDEPAVVATVLKNIRLTHPLGGELMTEQWRQADTLRVERQEPYETHTQKVPPLHVVRSQGS